MKRETYLKIKKQKRKAKLLGILTALSLMGCANLEKNDADETKDIYEETFGKEEHAEIIYSNGVLYPSKLDNFVETEFDAFSNMALPIYDSYKKDRNIIAIIPEYQTMNRTYTNGEFSYITTEDGINGYVHDELITILPDNYVEVDISDQKVKVVDNNEVILYCDVVTGKPGRDTNIGYTDIWAKTYDRALTGPGYSRDVSYFFVFNDCEEGFHDANWRNEFGGTIYETNGSLGCVNMNIEDVKIMDEHTEVGTKVLVHK